MNFIHKISILTLLLFLSMGAWAQNTTIKGKVVDIHGNPVNGAKISLVNQKNIMAVTDAKGEFQFFATTDELYKVETSQNGTKSFSVKEKEMPVVVKMDFSAQTLDLAFGVTQSVSESTGAISYTSEEEINKRSSFSTANSLYGNALGLTTLQNSGTSWDCEPSMYIRGLQTLSTNSILVLVDGIERDINYVVPEEVASVSVLRDAAAVALYGYKGINGAILVTTKRGKYQTREINVSYDHAFNWQYRKPKFVDSYTYANAINEALSNDGEDARYSENELNAFKSGKYPYLYPNVDWFKEVFRDRGYSNIYNVNFRGGGKRMRYFTMFNLQGNQGFIKHADENDGYSTQNQYSKANVRTNLDIDVTNTTMVKVNLMGVLSEFARPGLGSDYLMTKLYTVPAAAFPIKTEDDVWGGNSTWGDKMNPVALSQARGYSKGHTRSLFADLTLDQNLDVITEGLSATLRIGYDNIAAYWEGHTKTYAYGSDQVTSWNGTEPGETTRYSAGTDGAIDYADKLDWQDRHMNFNASINYNRALGSKGKLESSLIYSYENHVQNGQNSTYYRQNIAAYGHYVYNSKYIADLILVGSASNKLASGEKWSFSPTVSAAWVLSKEDFMSSVDFVNFLKLRASFGIINTDYIPTEDYWEQSFDGGTGYYLGENYSWCSGTKEGRLASTNSTHEKAFKYNIGLDASLFKGVDMTVDGYFEKRKDIWVSEDGSTSSVLGATAAYVNAGIVNSWGLEAGVNYNKKMGDVQLSLGGKFTFAKNEIKEQLETPRAYDYLRRTGNSVGQIFGLQAVGFFIDEADIKNSPAQQFSEVKPGDIKYKDQNGDGIINDYDQIAMGYNTSVPEIYYSFNLGAEWKGLGVSALFQGVANYSVVLNTQSVYWPLVNNTNISQHYYDNRWTPETPNAKYPRLTTESNDNNFQTNSVWLADASFLKLRNCEIYYKLPANVISKLKMKTCKIYVRGIDLLCIDHIDIADPESTGVAFPLTRSVNVGFTFGF